MRSFVYALASTLTFIILSIGSISVSQENGEVQDVSLLQLIATPRAFHGKRVRVVGFAFLEFEGDALWLHEEDFEHAIVKNSLWLEIPSAALEAYKRLNKQYVLVEGFFNADKHGHMGLSSGTLERITRYERWPTRTELEAQRK